MSDEEDNEATGEFSWSGELVDGWIPYGPGKATYANGDSFEGNYDDSKRNGTGKYIYSNGAEYEGNYSQNQKTGYGVMKYPDTSVYDGKLLSHHFNNLRILLLNSNCAWHRDMKHGEGKYTYPNQDIYKGEWKNNIRHGTGTYFFAMSMSQFIGTWLDGNYIAGQWVFRNGDVYEGSFKKNRPEGKGKFLFSANKTTVYGKFADKKWTQGDWIRTPACVLEAKEAVRKLPPPPVFNPVMDRSSQPCFVTSMKFM